MTDAKMLAKPFPREAIKQRKGGSGKMLDYVEGHTVIHRLNEATGNSWNFAVKDIQTTAMGADAVMVRAHVALEIPGLGVREHIGVQTVQARAGEDLIKGAITDALKKAATLFGVGLELYGRDYEAESVDREPLRIRASAPVPETRQRQAPPAQKSEQPAQQSTGFDAEASPKQRGMMAGLAKELGLDTAGLDRIAIEVTRTPAERLTRKQASLVIDRLKAMQADDPDADQKQAMRDMHSWGHGFGISHEMLSAAARELSRTGVASLTDLSGTQIRWLQNKLQEDMNEDRKTTIDWLASITPPGSDGRLPGVDDHETGVDVEAVAARARA